MDNISRNAVNFMLRYAYGGFLAFGLITLVAGDSMQKLAAVELISQGGAVGFFAIISLGTVIYVLHRRVVGEFLCYRFLAPLYFDYRWGKHEVFGYRLAKFLRKQGVEGGLRSAASEDIRARFDEWLASPQKEDDLKGRIALSQSRIDTRNFDHAESHVLYLTAEILSAIFVLSAIDCASNRAEVFNVGWPGIVLLLLGAFLFLFVAIAFDCELHRRENVYYRDKKDDLKMFLEASGYALKDASQHDPPHEVGP